MEHEYHTSRRGDDRRAWVPIVAVLALLAVAFGAVIVASGDAGAAEPGGSLPSLALRPATTTTTTVAPPTTVARITAPPVARQPSVTAEPDGPDEPGRAVATPEDDGPSTEPRPALRELADELGASEVSDIVPVGSDRYAMLVRSGDAELYRWTGSEWNSEQSVAAPGAVSDIGTIDLTGDGILDFLITLGGLRAPGAVLGRGAFGFELLPFNTNDGQEQWLDELRLSLGRLTSDVDVNGNRLNVRWTWTGRQFEVLG
jgi:hypothetical protein